MPDGIKFRSDPQFSERNCDELNLIIDGCEQMSISHISIGNFGLLFKTFCLFRKFPGRSSQKRNLRNFGVNGKQPWKLALKEFEDKK